MTSFRDFHAFASSRGDGLLPELQKLLIHRADHDGSEMSVRPDGMLQSGPDPESGLRHDRPEAPLHQRRASSSLMVVGPDGDLVSPFLRGGGL